MFMKKTRDLMNFERWFDLGWVFTLDSNLNIEICSDSFAGCHFRELVRVAL